MTDRVTDSQKYHVQSAMDAVVLRFGLMALGICVGSGAAMSVAILG